MPNGPVPAQFRDLLETPVMAQLATVDSKGRPQVNPVWCLWDGKHVLISVRAETVKYRNLRREPHLAISLLDPANSFRYLEIRGEAIEFQRFDTLEFVNLLSRKYTGGDFTGGHAEQERYRVRIQINSWTGVN